MKKKKPDHSCITLTWSHAQKCILEKRKKKYSSAQEMIQAVMDAENLLGEEEAQEIATCGGAEGIQR